MPKPLQTTLEKRADQYLFKNYRRKYDLVQIAVDNKWDTAVIAQQFCGINFFLGIIIILAANQMYNDRKSFQEAGSNV
jgi:hypothetical protein